MSSKDEIFEYVMNTPENTNPAVLRSMLDELSDGGTSGWQEVNLITVDNLEWTLSSKGYYYVEIEQEIDVKPQDFIICTIGDELVQNQSACIESGEDVFILVEGIVTELYWVFYYPQIHIVEIQTLVDPLSPEPAPPTANTFILSKLTKVNLSDPSLPDEPVVADDSANDAL